MSQLRVLNDREINSEWDERIKAGLCRCFPSDVATFSKTRAWHGSLASYTILMEEDGNVVGHVGVVRRKIFVTSLGGEDAKPRAAMEVAGIQNVFIVPEKRKTGLLQPLMGATIDEAHRRQLDVGLLFCLPVLEKAYAKLGWQTIHPSLVIATKSSGERYNLDDKNSAMFHPVMLQSFPAGEIDLNGDDW